MNYLRSGEVILDGLGDKEKRLLWELFDYLLIPIPQEQVNATPPVVTPPVAPQVVTPKVNSNDLVV